MLVWRRWTALVFSFFDKHEQMVCMCVCGCACVGVCVWVCVCVCAPAVCSSVSFISHSRVTLITYDLWLHCPYSIITLCAYAQQGYVFGHVGLCMCVCMCVYVCMYVYVDKKRAVWGLTTGKSPVSVIYCSLVEFNGQKRGLLCQAIRSGKEIWNHSINGT